jgi:hypothetical protein
MLLFLAQTLFHSSFSVITGGCHKSLPKVTVGCRHWKLLLIATNGVSRKLPAISRCHRWSSLASAATVIDLSYEPNTKNYFQLKLFG